jgi:type IV secretion system protein VirB9
LNPQQWIERVAMGCLTGALATVEAAGVPAPGATDHRIRSAAYDREQVYTVTGFYGYATTLLFRDGERVRDVLLGDPDAWDVRASANALTVKPKAMEPDTSMVVLTNERSYVFDVRAKPPRKTAAGQALDRDQSFLIRFNYPEQEAARARAETAAAEAREQAQRQLDAERRVVAHLPDRAPNRKFSFSGSRDLAPVEVWDDGTFTYLRFAKEQPLPAVYTVGPDGQEVIAPKHFERGVLTIQNVAQRLVLRKGALVTCLWNEGGERRTEYEASGTSDRAGARLLKPVR